MINIGKKYYILSCNLSCKVKHTEDRVAVLLNENLDEDEEQNQPETQLAINQNEQESITQYNISLNNNLCKNKLMILSNLFKKEENGIYLNIEDIDSKNLYYAFDFLKGQSIRGLKLGFIQVFQKFKQADLHKFFNFVQELGRLESLSISNKDDLIQNNPSRMKIPLFQVTKNGSLQKLKHLSINSTLMQMNFQTLQNLERALTSQSGEGQLINFSLNTVECELDKKSFRFINSILHFNRNTLQNIDFKIAEFDFEIDNPINEIGKAVEEMKELRSIQLQLNLIQSDFEQVNTSLQRLCSGIYKCKSEHLDSITLVFLNVYVMACSLLGQALSRFRSIQYFGPVTETQAKEMGIALGKSNQLESLNISSPSAEMALMVSYIFHFSRTLKHSQIDYQGRKLVAYKELQLGLAANNSIEELQIANGNSSASKMKGLIYIGKGLQTNQTIKKLTIMYNSQGGLDWFYQFVESLTKNTSLEQLCLDFSSEDKTDKLDPSVLSQHICQIKNLQIFELNFNPLLKKKKKEKITYIKLLKGVMEHSYAFNFVLGDQFEDLQTLSDEYYSECENLMLQLITFEKYISKNLDFHPQRHIEDLVF